MYGHRKEMVTHMDAALVPGSIIISMIVSAVISMGMPLALGIIWMRKKKVRSGSFLVGAGVFVLFVLVLESTCHRLVLGSGSVISQNPLFFILYSVLAAGIFEETGRFLAFKTVMKKEQRKEASVSYGIGHGGIEAIILVGIPMLLNIAVIFTINSMGGLDAYVAAVPQEAQEATRVAFQSFYTASPVDVLSGGIERIAAITMHISLSVMVFLAAKRPGKIYLYPLAVVIHALFNLGASLFQQGILKQIILLEIVALLMAGGAAFFAWRLYQADGEKEQSKF